MCDACFACLCPCCFVMCKRGCGSDCWINFFLGWLCYIPAVIHACSFVNEHDRNQPIVIVQQQPQPQSVNVVTNVNSYQPLPSQPPPNQPSNYPPPNYYNPPQPQYGPTPDFNQPPNYPPPYTHNYPQTQGEAPVNFNQKASCPPQD